MKKLKNKEKFVLTTKLLVDQNGKKMGKTEGNIVSLDTKPEEMFGKVMSWSDGLILIGFELLTTIPQAEINSIAKNMKSGQMNPRDAKARLASEITSLLWGSENAVQAEKHFTNIFVNKNNPDDILTIEIENGERIADVMVKEKLALSNAKAQRLVVQGGVKFNNQKIIAIAERVHQSGILQVGKRKFLKIIIK